MQNNNNSSFLLHVTADDIPYLPIVKQLIKPGTKVALSNAIPVTLTEILILAKEKGVKRVATTSEVLLKLLLDGKKSSKNDYAGSVQEKSGVEFLTLNPLEHLVSTNSGKFLFSRYISKFIEAEKWIQFPEFSFEVFQPNRAEALIELAADATFIAIDIETGPEEERVITCVGLSFWKLAAGKLSTTTVVVPFNDMYNVAFLRIVCSSFVPKVLQNGKYDNAYLLRFNIPVYNWCGDTQHLFHSWYAELPKRLDFITSFLVRKWQFWKDEAATSNIYNYYQYNAKDAFITGACWISLLSEAPEWAFRNYFQEFPLVFPCLLSELTGLRRDNAAMLEEEKRFEKSLEAQLLSLRKMTANFHYNPSSPQQTVRLIAALGSSDVTSSNSIAIDKVKARHPLNKRILSANEKFREDRKLTGTYLRDADPKTGRTKSWNGRIFYSLNPHGTDTGRLASKESAFWCGWQIHNIPRDRDDIQVRKGIISDPGFYLGECDRSQAEARDTAYLSGDIKLITAVENKARDFHGHNASAFFGIPYNEIVESKQEESGEWKHKVLNKGVRQVSKNTNHGANYNMGPKVMVDTMGLEAVFKARELLKLPRTWTALQVCQHLLDAFSDTYKIVKGDWYKKVIADVVGTQMLVGPTGWTRYCFGQPQKNKRDLNAYVAHPPQSLNAMELNYAYMRVFYEIALVEPKDFKLGPQIHDSILFQYRKGRRDLAVKVRDCMDNPVEVADTYGLKRIMRIPTDLKGEAERWSELLPSHEWK